MLDWRGTGMSVMEMSHRSPAFGDILQEAEADLRELLAVPSNFRVLFMQGGGLAQNALAPLNLSQGKTVDFLVTGSWSSKSYREAGKYCQANLAASSEADHFLRIPETSTWRLSPEAQYLHLCTNETIHGVEFQSLPDLATLDYKAPLVIDCSSHIASRPIDWTAVGMAFAGAQKNIGPAGMTVVIVRDDLLGRALPICPSAFDYSIVAQQHSMFNTPPTYAIYIAGLVFKWIKAQGGVNAMEHSSLQKSQALYRCIDVDAGGFYENRVDPACRSRMNVPFFLKDESLNDVFLKNAEGAGLLQLKGHKLVGGMRASLYNAMPLAGVEALVAYMQEFARTHG
jgi:phosphoserine aminotransferase